MSELISFVKTFFTDAERNCMLLLYDFAFHRKIGITDEGKNNRDLWWQYTLIWIRQLSLSFPVLVESRGTIT